jgi:recombinational DNA repair ATPase RecF
VTSNMKSNEAKFITGFGFAGYRSFGRKLQRIGPCEKINLIIGQNNSGKSNILRFLCDHYLRLPLAIQGSGEWKLTDLEVFRSLETFPGQLSLAISPSEEHVRNWAKQGEGSRQNCKKEFNRLLRSVAIDPCGDGFWITATVAARIERRAFLMSL